MRKDVVRHKHISIVLPLALLWGCGSNLNSPTNRLALALALAQQAHPGFTSWRHSPPLEILAMVKILFTLPQRANS